VKGTLLPGFEQNLSWVLLNL